MNKSHKTLTVSECKIQTSILLKSLRSKEPEKARSAAVRFLRMPEFKELSLEEIIKSDLKRKHALAVVALEHGFKSWTELKCQLPFIRGGFLNQWFSQYADARSYREMHGGYLLPYKKQFYVCDANYIAAIGLDPEDPDWKLADHDLAKPLDREACTRIHQKINSKDGDQKS